MGAFDPFRPCKHYLLTKPKFHSFCQSMLDEEAGKNKKERPVEENKKLITSALKEAGCIARAQVVQSPGLFLSLHL